MKLAKLSLAAIVAVGALTTANAKPLEEAIKGVEFSGFVEWQVNMKDLDGVKTTYNDWDALAKFTAPVADNLKVVTSFATTKQVATTAVASPTDYSTNDGGPVVQAADLAKVFFVYKKDALTVSAGLQAIGAPFTDNGFNGQKGNGVIGMYNVGPVTLASLYFYNTNVPTLTDREIAGAAAIGSMGPVSAQLWYAKVQDYAEMMFAQADVAVAGASLTGQYISTKVIGGETGTFYALKAAYALNGYGISVSYTDNDEDQPIHALDGDEDTDVIAAGWRIQNTYDESDIENSYSIDLSAKFGAFGAVAGYSKAEFFTDEDVKEWYIGGSYAYSKNFNVYARYADVNHDDSAEDFKYMRFDAKYSF